MHQRLLTNSSSLIWFLFFILSCHEISEIRSDEVLVDQRNVTSGDRKGRIFSIFNVIRFENGPCEAGSRNGTCYTAEECASLGGNNGGTCAQGFGVCCTFIIGCGQTSSENCTYFESSGTVAAGACTAEICRINDNVCQLRLDFQNFIITGPSTLTESVGLLLNGQPTALAGKGTKVSNAGRCLTDTFSAVSRGGASPPVICGSNSGDHMYMDANEDCNDLIFQFGNTGVGTTIPSRSFMIKVTQVSCSSELLAPSGCVQYYFGPTTSTVQSYNFDGGRHLNNQVQSICVRRERGQCRICWTAVIATEFDISGKSNINKGYAKFLSCCNYGTNGMKAKGYDCVIIPGAVNKTIKDKVVESRICGRAVGLVTTASSITGKSVCSTANPFRLTFQSDEFEFTGGTQEANNKFTGFRLAYIQDALNCDN